MVWSRNFLLRKIIIVIHVVWLLMISCLYCKHRSSLNLLLLVLLLLLLSHKLLFLSKAACICSTAHHWRNLIVATLPHLWHVKVTMSLRGFGSRCTNHVCRLLLRSWTSNCRASWNCIFWNTTTYSIRIAVWWGSSARSINLKTFI
jgi:hypothetical protein